MNDYNKLIQNNPLFQFLIFNFLIKKKINKNNF